MTRTFTILNSCINISGGRYKSKSPINAAKKVASRLFKKAKFNQKYRSIRKITFCLRETTQTAQKQLYYYKASFVKLKEPKLRIVNGKEIINRYEFVVKSHVPIVNMKFKKARGGANSLINKF